MLTAIQTIVGQVNSEFQGDVTSKIRLGAVSRLHGDSAWENCGGKVREWARTKRFKVTSTAGGDPANNSRAERCVGILKRTGRSMLIGSGLPNSTELWPLAVKHAAFCHRCSVQGRKVSWPRWGAKVFSKIKDTPNDSFAPRAREGFFVGVSTERSKTILVLRSHDEVVELEPVTSYVEMSGDDPEPQEEKKIDVHEDPISNVLRDNDQQQQDEFFDYNEGDESDDFDVNTVPMTFHPVVKDAGATIVSAKDVEKSSRSLREEWRLAIHHAMQSLKEHDVYQEVAEEE